MLQCVWPLTARTDILYGGYTPTPENSSVLIGDLGEYRIECCGKVDVMYDSEKDAPLTLLDVAFIPRLGTATYFH